MPPDHMTESKRRLCIASFLFLGWILLLLASISALCTLNFNAFSVRIFQIWAGLSLATHLIWFCTWEDEYHRLAIHCEYITGIENADPFSLIFLNAGSLPGFLLGVMLTD
jgi:hypothetical protein